MVKRIFKNQGFRDVGKLMGGTTVAQAISFLMYPLLTRIYTPTEIGILSLFLSILSFIAMIAPFQLDQAVLSARDERHSKAIAGTFWFIAISFIVTSWIVVLALKLLGFPSLNDLPMILVVLLPLFAIPASTARFSTMIAVREKAFGIVALGASIAQISSTGAKIVFGYSFPNLTTLFTSELLYYSFIPIFMFAANRRIWSQTFAVPKFEKIRSVTREYRSLMTSGQFSMVLYSANQMLPLQYVAFQYTSNEVGLFAFSYGIIGALARNVGISLNHVFSQRFSHHVREGRVAHAYSLYKKTVFKSLALGLFASILLSIISHDGFSIYFGAKWETAGPLIAPLMLLFLSHLIAYPTSTTLKVLVKPAWTVRYEALQAALCFGIFGASVWNSVSLLNFAWAYGTANFVVALVYFINATAVLKHEIASRTDVPTSAPVPR